MIFSDFAKYSVTRSIARSLCDSVCVGYCCYVKEGAVILFAVSHLTYLVQLLYLGKLSRPKYHEFSLKLRIFPMLQY